MERRTCDNHHDEHGNQGEAKIDQPGENIGKRKQILGNIDLFNEGRVGNNRIQSRRRRLGVKREQQRPGQVVNREIGNILLKQR